MASLLLSLSPYVTTLLVVLGPAICTFCLYLLYRWGLPRPVPGIPYNRAAAKSLLGDLPSLLKHLQITEEKLSWFPVQVAKLNSPIIQVFVRPFARPWVILADFRESQDILLRRTKEFDRGPEFRQVLSGITPDHHIIMSSSNPDFKMHRRLIQDLMTHAFLKNVCLTFHFGRCRCSTKYFC
jgi:hypothetical protein